MQITVGLVLGEQLNPNGDLPEEFQNRLRKCAADYHLGVLTYIIVSGAATIPSLPTEAAAAKHFLISVCNIDSQKILEEPLARTTGQNIRFSLSILRELGAVSVRIFGRKSQKIKTLVYVNRLWQKRFITSFASCHDSKGFFFRLVDQTAMVFLAHIDPTEERVTKPLQRWFRYFFVPAHS